MFIVIPLARTGNDKINKKTVTKMHHENNPTIIQSTIGSRPSWPVVKKLPLLIILLNPEKCNEISTRSVDRSG